MALISSWNGSFFMVKINCALCGKEKTFRSNEVKRGKGRFCSKECVYRSMRGRKPWNFRGIIIFNCPQCGKEVQTTPDKRSRGEGKYCSNKCGNLSRRGKPSGRLGIKILKNSGELSWEWKGDEVGYWGLHAWVYKHLGKAMRCDYKNCVYPRTNSRGVTYLFPKAFHWANISHEYKRDLKDWIQLCVSCHSQYDHGKLEL